MTHIKNQAKAIRNRTKRARRLGDFPAPVPEPCHPSLNWAARAWQRWISERSFIRTTPTHEALTMGPAIVEAYAPETLNDGAPVPAALHERFETSLLSLYGGFTRGPDVSGAWRDPETGTVYRERNRSYRIVVPGDRALATLHSLKSDVETLYQQKLAYVTVSPLIASTIN